MIADYNHINEVCCTVAALHNGGQTAGIIAGLLGKTIGNDTNPFSYQTVGNQLPTNYLVGQGISAEADLQLGFAKLTSITAYRDQKYNVSQDVDFTGADLVNQNTADRYKTFTQEFRLTSTGKGPFTWLLGAFYSHEDIATDNKLTYGADSYNYLNILGQGTPGLLSALTGPKYFLNGQGIDDNWDMVDKSYSIFGQADYKLTSKLTLTGGLAYLHDQKSLNSNIILNDPFSATNFNNIPALGFVPTAALGANAATAPLVPALTGLGYANLPANLFSGAVTNQNPGLAALAAGLVPGETPATQAFYSGLLSQALAGVNGFGRAVGGGLNQLQFFYGDTANHGPVNCTGSGDCARSDNKLTYTARLAYAFNRHVNFYASYSTGWKGAAANLSNASRPVNAQGYGRFANPEDTEVYEVGLKTRFRQGYANITGFYEKIKNLQNNAFVGTAFVLANAGSESVKGFEFDSSYSPVRALTLGLNATYIAPKYDSFVNAPCATLVTVNAANCPINGGSASSHDVSGSSPGDSPPWSVTASALYTADLGHGNSAYIRGEYDFASSYLSSNTVDPKYSTTSVSSINASLGFSTASKLDVNFWVRNLTNDHSFIASFQTTLQNFGSNPSYSAYPNEPRTYGVTIRKSF